MAIPKTEWIWQNGQFVKWDEATVHVTAHALHYGSSVFEGLRAYATPNGPAILGLQRARAAAVRLLPHHAHGIALFSGAGLSCHH